MLRSQKIYIPHNQPEPKRRKRNHAMKAGKRNASEIINQPEKKRSKGQPYSRKRIFGAVSVSGCSVKPKKRPKR